MWIPPDSRNFPSDSDECMGRRVTKTLPLVWTSTPKPCNGKVLSLPAEQKLPSELQGWPPAGSQMPSTDSSQAQGSPSPQGAAHPVWYPAPSECQILMLQSPFASARCSNFPKLVYLQKFNILLSSPGQTVANPDPWVTFCSTSLQKQSYKPREMQFSACIQQNLPPVVNLTAAEMEVFYHCNCYASFFFNFQLEK